MPACQHGQQIEDQILEQLHDSQAGSGRHRCVACAYQKGKSDGQAGKIIAHRSREYCAAKPEAWAPRNVVSALPENQGHPGRHLCTICAYYAGLCDALEARDKEELSEVDGPLEALGDDGESEGERRLRTHYVLERSRENRIRAMLHHQPTCVACGFEFDKFYGEALARSFIEFHHVIPLAELKGARVNVRRDLVPLCANCHRMVHRTKGVVLDIDELRRLIAIRRQTQT